MFEQPSVYTEQRNCQIYTLNDLRKHLYICQFIVINVNVRPHQRKTQIIIIVSNQVLKQIK